MKITAFRETIGGIEVVDAEYADKLFTATKQVADARHGVYMAKYSIIESTRIFGRKSEEVALWKSTLDERAKLYQNKWDSLRRVMKKAKASE